MFEVLTGLFDMTGFPPRKESGPGWTPALIWLHVTSDLFIWLAYLSIPLVLLYFTRRRDLPYPRLFVLFALFILACGTTHLIDALIFEYPIYRFAGVMKGVTAVVSWATVVALVPVVPRVMSAVAAANQPGAVTKQHRALPPEAVTPPPGHTRGYIVAVLAAVLATLVRAALDPVLRDGYAFIVALLPIVYVSWQYGFGPGMACVGVVAAAHAYFFVPPRGEFLVTGLGNQIALALFFFSGAACAALGESQRVARRRARMALETAIARREELESEVTRRRVVEAALRQRETDLVAAQRQTDDALARLNAFLDNAPLGIAFFDPDLRYVRINAFLAAANGKPVEAHTGRQLTEMVPDFPPEVAAAYRRAAGPDGQPFTTQFRRADPRAPGTTRAWRATAFPVRDADGRALGAGVIAQDVTAALKAEEDVRRSERNLSDFFENANVGLHWVGPDGIVLRANKAELEMLGYARDEYVGRPIAEFHDDPGTICDILTRLQRGEKLDNYPARLRRKDGTTRDVLISSSVLWENGKFVHTRCFTRDVTELKRAEEELRASETRFREMIDALPAAIYTTDAEGRLTHFNPAAVALSGRAPELDTDRWCVSWKLYYPDGTPMPHDTCPMAVGLKEGRVVRGAEVVAERPDGTRVWFAPYPTPLRDARGAVVGGINMLVDITDRKRAEEAVRESEARFRSMADSSPALIWLSEPDGRRTYFNKTWVEFTGRPADEQLGSGWVESVHPDDREQYLSMYSAALTSRRPFELEYRLRRHDGADRWVLARGTLRFTPSGGFAGFVGLCLDVTERRRAEADLRESEERFRLTVDETAVPTLLHADDDTVLLVNKAFTDLTGYTHADVPTIGDWTRRAYGEQHKTAKEYLDTLFGAGARVDNGEWEVAIATGEKRVWHFYATPVGRDATGRRLVVSNAIDVTEAKRAEAEIRRSEERYRLLTEAVPHIVWNADAAGEVTYVNRQWTNYTAAPIERAGGREWLESVHPDDRDRVYAAWQHTVSRPAPGVADRFQHEFRLRDARTGGYRWFLSVAVALCHPDGTVDRWIGSMADIHDQKTAAETIRESEAFRKSVFENSPDCLKIIDLDGRVLEMNESGCRLMEIDDFSTVRGERWADLWPAANRETIREAVETARAGQTGRFQGFCPTAKGTAKYWDVSVAAVPGADGTPFRLIGVSRDVTEQRRAEDAVRASEARFRTLTEAVPQMVWTADPKGEVTFFNRRWDEYTAVPLDLARAAGWANNPVHPDDTDRLRAGWQLAVARGAEGYSEEFRLRRAADGAYRWMLSVAVPLRDSIGTLTEWVGTLTDIDDQKRQTETLEHLVRERTQALEETNLLLMAEVAERRAAEEQVRAVAAELERSNGELEKFAYVASHDLQEPLRKIQAFGDRLQTKCRDALPDTGRDFVDRMLAAAGRMRRLIDDLLTFSRVTTQRRPYKRLDLERLVREVVSDLEVRITQAGGTVHVGPLPDLDADPSQMRQLFQNLIANAVKFHRPGVPPVVTVEGEPFTRAPAEPGDGEPVPMVRVTVRDNGIGFDEKYRDRIFDVFQRLHGRDEYEGTGVGLAICRKILERHGGTITAHSKEGEGATFVVTLPARQHNPREAITDDVQPEQTDHHIDGR